MADHVEGLDHNSVYRYLKGTKLSPALIWEKVKDRLVQSDKGYLILDDTVLEKPYAFDIEGVRRQYSGNAHGIVKGIGLVNLVYYHPELDQYWVIDYRLFDPERDGKTKLAHVNDMLSSAQRRGLRYQTVLMDSWYATVQLMMRLHQAGKCFYCPIKKNRLVDERGGQAPYCPVETLTWSETELQTGKTVKLKGFPGATYLKLFRVVLSTERTEYIVTNELTQADCAEAQKESSHRWKIEQFHREEKQLTGLESCQCRLNRSQRNHICACLLVWLCLKDLAYQTQQTIYQLKHNLLSDYLCQQLRNPSITFT